MSVLDDQDHHVKSDAPSNDDLRHITGINPEQESAMDREAARGAAEDERTGLFNTVGDTRKPKPNANDLGASALSSAAAITPVGGAAKVAKFFLGSRKRKAATAGGVGLGGIACGFIAFIIFLGPILRINNMTTFLQKRFFAVSESVIDKETNRLVTRYFVKQVMPGMVTNKCYSTVINRSCALVSKTDTPVGALFNTWKDARLENKLANVYGIEIERNGRNEFTIKTPTITTPEILGNAADVNSPNFESKVTKKLSRTEVRNEIRHAFDGETRWKQVMYRFSYGKLLERKYGVRRCILACEKRDKVTDSIASRKVAFSSKLNERVIKPRSEMYSLVFDCALSGFDCAGGDQVDENGEHSNKFERDLRSRLAEYRLQVGDKGLEELNKDAAKVREKGITNYLTEKLLGETTAKIAAKGVPIVGWLDLGMTITNAASNVGPALKKLTYATYAATAVETYMLYQTAANEVKAGKTDPVALGSISDSLNANPDADQGGLSGEESPLYKSLTGETNPSVASGNFDIFPTADAASKSVEPYTCDDGKPPTGVVCDEEKVGAESLIGTAAKYVSQLQNAPMYQVQDMTAKVWTTVVGKIFSAAGWVISKINPVRIPEFIKEKLGPIAKAIVETMMSHVVPNPLSKNPSGARLFDIAAAGADFSANDFAHTKLGGRVLTDQEVATILEGRLNDEKQQFASQSLFARMFSTTNTHSMVSRLALATPSSWQGVVSRTSSTLLSNPFTNLFNGLGSVWRPSNAFAASGKDPFGITQFGYTDKDLAAIGDDDEYWRANCTDLSSANTAWGKSATENADTGQFDNSTTNPCLIIQTAVAAGGGKYNTDLIPEYGQLADGSSGASDATGLLDQSTVFTDSTNIPCAPGTVDRGIQDGYHDLVKVLIRTCAVTDLPSTGSGDTDGVAVVNSRISANIVQMVQAAKADGVVLSADSSFRTMAAQIQAFNNKGRDPKLAAPPGKSNHQMGLAIDFSEPNVKNRDATSCATRAKDQSSAQWNWLEDNAAQFGFKQYMVESWHWDVLTDATRCGGDGT